MPDELKGRVSLAIDNILKFAIAALVSILAWVGSGMHSSIKELERKVGGIEIVLTELKTDLKHYSHGRTPQN
jgi:hypothetical protein